MAKSTERLVLVMLATNVPIKPATSNKRTMCVRFMRCVFRSACSCFETAVGVFTGSPHPPQAKTCDNDDRHAHHHRHFA